MKKQYFIIIALLLAALMLMSSCSEKVEEKPDSQKESTSIDNEKNPDGAEVTTKAPNTGDGDEETKAEAVGSDDPDDKNEETTGAEETTKIPETDKKPQTSKPDEDTNSPVVTGKPPIPEETVKPAPETQSPIISGRKEVDPPAPGVLEKVVKDYYNYYVENYQFSPDVIGTVYVERYEGTYDGAVVVLMNGTMFSSVEWKREILVAGYTFTYYGGNMSEVWKDGEFYSLVDAYNEGILTKEHIEKIYKMNPIVYKKTEYTYPNP